MRRVALMVASVFGIGYAPVAPGTVGSVAAVLAGYGLLHLGWGVLALATVLATVLGIWAVSCLGALDDPEWVVVDEVAGQWLTMLALPAADPVGAVTAFALFRLFDITKPGPVGRLDQRGDAAGVVLDDVAAGALAALTILVLRAVLMAVG